MKPENVKIINITISEMGGTSKMIFGLGDDSMIYWWNASDHIWKLWA